MSDDFETRLRDALRPENPRGDFETRLMARIAEAPAAGSPAAGSPADRKPAVRSRATGWFSAAIAATVILAVGLQHYRNAQLDREKGLEARREVMQALRVTNDKLDLAYRTVKDESGVIGGEPGV